MSNLRDAQDAIDLARHYVDQAQKVAPHYSVEAFVFARAELRLLHRRIGNLRKVLGDLDTEPPGGA